MTFNSDEVNYMVYRYLEESGFHHSAYTFGMESNVFNAGIDGTLLPRGALISIMQKGIFFAEAELFNLINEVTEDGGRLEKAVGSMPLFEAVLPDAPQRRAFEARMKETSPPTTTPNVPNSYDHSSSATTSAAIKSEASSAPSTSVNAMTTATSTTNHNGPSHNHQSSRDRDFRAQQSANNGPLNGGPPPRGPYRTHALTPTPSSASTSVLTNHHSQNASTANYNHHLSVSSGSSSSLSNGSSAQTGLHHMDRERDSREATTPGSRQQFLNGNYVAGHGAKLKAVQQAQLQSGSVIYGAHS